MAKLVVTYGNPADPAAFDRYYHEQHVPLAKALPGLRGYRISSGPIMTPDGPADAYLVATLDFDDMAAIGAAMASPQGQATAADVGKFATGGATLMMFDDRSV